MFGARRWCFTTCVLFMLCPTRYHVDADSRKYFHNPVRKPSSARWSINIVRNKISATSVLADAEPGFDFDEDEMVKLKIWPGGVIPYYIDEFSFDKVFRDRVRTFLDTTNGVTGLNFIELHRPPNNENTRWVLFLNRQGLLSCADHPYKNFTNKGVQKVILGYDCLSTGGELAEAVLALVGVPPQHNAPDRDLFVTVDEKNILPDKKYLFEVLKDNEWLFHKMDYDYYSAGHYALHKYTVNGMATIKPLHALDFSIGEGKGFSYTDVWKIRMLYNFITNKRRKAVNLPECNKLFDVSSNISNYQPNVCDNLTPRKKPNKYLGLPDNSSELSDQENENVSNVNNKKDPGKENLDNSSGNDAEKPVTNDDTNVGINQTEDKDKKEQEHLTQVSNDKIKSNGTANYKKLVGNIGNDGNILLQMSDYGTDDDRSYKPIKKTKYSKQVLKFTKPGGKLRRGRS